MAIVLTLNKQTNSWIALGTVFLLAVLLPERSVSGNPCITVVSGLCSGKMSQAQLNQTSSFPSSLGTLYLSSNNRPLYLLLESFSKSRYRPNSRYFYRNFKNSVKSIAFLRYPGPNSVGRNAIFWIHAVVPPVASDVFFLPVYRPPALMKELLLVFGGFERKKQARSLPESDGFLPTFSVSADIDVHPCSVVKRPKAHSYLWASNLHTSFESSIGLTMTVQVSALANAFWNGEQEGRHDSQSQGAHTWVSLLGQAIGAATMGERSAGPFQFKVQTRHFYCENYTENLLKLFFQFTLFSIHAIGIAWNAILLKVSIVWVQLKKGGATRLLGSFYSEPKAIDMAEKSSSSSSSGIDKALEGEPIITWTCAVLKGVLRSQGGRLTGKKEYLVWRQIVHLVTKGWSVISTESLPRLVFTELSSVTKTPRLKKHWKSSVSGRSEADDKTTKSDDSVRKGAPLTDWVTLWWLHILPICIPSRQLYEKLFSW